MRKHLTKNEKKVFEVFKKALQQWKNEKKVDIWEKYKGEWIKTGIGEAEFIKGDERWIYAFWCPNPNAREMQHKDINFAIRLKDLKAGKKICELAREYHGLGNGSYYLVDMEKEKIIYHEDD